LVTLLRVVVTVGVRVEKETRDGDEKGEKKKRKGRARGSE
jgi:hypothetical protein